MQKTEYIYPDWPAAANVRALATTRLHSEGNSGAHYAQFNLGLSSGEQTERVVANRQLLQQALPATPLWLQQVHGKQVIAADEHHPGIEADGSLAVSTRQVCVVLTADCLPILLCDQAGSCVAAVHAGWRGLNAGIIAVAIQRLPVGPHQLMAWLGPAISQPHYAVDEDFRDRFVAQRAEHSNAFRKINGQWHADLYMIARQQLSVAGVDAVFGGGFCTYADQQRFYSYRRDAQTGRQASMIWLD